MRAARLIFAGGGTGGHLYPAIAIANRVTELLKDSRGSEIIFVGTPRGIEYRVRDTLGYPLHIINIRGIVRSFTLKNLLVPFLIVSALWRSSRLIASFQPDLVVATGGYVCWPIARAAAGRKVPIVLQEQNSYPGISTRKLAPLAQRIYLGFAKGAEYFHTSAQMIVTGNPVRQEIGRADKAEARRAFGLDPNRTTILVIGGSQGARGINQAVLRSLTGTAGLKDVQLLWQTGKTDYTGVVAQAGEHARGHVLFPFENRMAQVYAAADIAVARSGAITLAELEASRLPAILVPYPHAAGDHQRHNAEEFVRAGYAEMVDESHLGTTDIIARASELVKSGKVAQMREAMQVATKDRKPAVDVIAEDIVALLNASTSAREAL